MPLSFPLLTAVIHTITIEASGSVNMENSTISRQNNIIRLTEIEYQLAELMEERAQIRLEMFGISDPQNNKSFRGIRYDDGSFIQQHANKCKSPTTNSPTQHPSNSPTEFPTNKPTKHPTYRPTYKPTESPTFEPTDTPTIQWDHAQNSSPQRQKAQPLSADDIDIDVPSSNVSTLPIQSSIELFKLTLWDGNKDPFLPQDHFEFDEFLNDRIDTKKYDLIITKYPSNASNVKSYHEEIDTMYEEAHANFMILVIEGPNVANLARFHALINLFGHYCSRFFNQNDKGRPISFPKSVEVTNAIMRAKLESERYAKTLAIDFCEKLFWCIHALKMKKVEHLLHKDAWFSLKTVRDNIQSVFDATKRYIVMHTNKTVLSRAEVLMMAPYYDLSGKEMAKMNTIKTAHIVKILFDEWMQHNPTKPFRVCVIALSISDIGIRIAETPQENLMVLKYQVLWYNFRKRKSRGHAVISAKIKIVSYFLGK